MWRYLPARQKEGLVISLVALFLGSASLVSPVPFIFPIASFAVIGYWFRYHRKIDEEGS